MQTYESVMESLVNAGYKCYLVTKDELDPVQFPELHHFKDPIFRVEISTTRLPPLPGDRSFWIRKDSDDHWTIGFWSCFEYTYNGRDMLAVCLEILRSSSIPEGHTPCLCPADIMAKYDITGINC